MTLLRILGALLFAIVLAPLLVLPAAAQSLDVQTILDVARPWLVEMAGALAALVVAWIANVLRQRLNLDIEARHREALQTALTNAVGLAIVKVDTMAGGAKLDLRNAVLAEAVSYVLKGAPDALRYFGVTPERVREMVLAKAGVVAADVGA